MSLLKKLRNILIIVKIFYWFAFKASMKALYHKQLSLSQDYWSDYTVQYFKATMHRLRNSQELRRQRSLILANHITQADFFVHTILSEYKANFLSRLLVGIVFFIFFIVGQETVWFFNRSASIDPQKFNNWLDQKFRKSHKPSLLVYPQGHRMGATSKVDKQKLKAGMVRYAYRRELPVQILISFGNELIFNEKKLEMNWNQHVYYSYSKVYLPSDFQSQDDFVKFIKDEFTNFFDKIHQQYTKAIGSKKQESQQQEKMA